MILAVDVYYSNMGAKSVAVTFNWQDAQACDIFTADSATIEEYVPGQFYKRELPGILQVLELIDMTTIEAIVVDGHVYIDNDLNYGLGGHLWEALDRKVPVIGVAKTPFYQNKETVIPVLRGQSQNPLYVSAIGTDKEPAAKHVLQMHGTHRIPSILKQLDRLTKTI